MQANKQPITFCCMRNVYLFPHGLHQTGISGILSLIEDVEVCITWQPSPDTRGENSSMAYSMRIPLDDVITIRQCLPKFGQHSIIVTVKDGHILHPFYFYEGGVKNFIQITKQIVPFSPTETDTDLYERVQPILAMDFLPPPPSEENPNQTSFSGTHSSPVISYPPVPKNERAPEVNAPSSTGWGIFNNVKKLADTATTWLNEIDESATDSLDFDDFELIAESGVVNRVSLAEETVHKQPRSAPLSSEEWINSFDMQGRVRGVDLLREKIYQGGMEPSLRPEVWKYLLNYYPFDSTYEEREIIKQQKEVEYHMYQSQWQSITEEQESHFSKFRSLKERIDKDVVRTDRTWDLYKDDNSPQLQEIYRILLTYSFFNFDIGYVQGMNDLVSVLLIVTQNEVDAYWCFKGLMDRIMLNFDRDQVGMHTQLTQLSDIVKHMDEEFYKHLLEVSGTNMFFCFKWLLIIFKREFPLDDVQRIWEVLWSDYYTQQHQLFVCLAMLLNTKKDVLEENMEFDDILRHLNSTSKTMDATQMLIDADCIYRKFITICDSKTQKEILSKKEAPPALGHRRQRSN